MDALMRYVQYEVQARELHSASSDALPCTIVLAWKRPLRADDMTRTPHVRVNKYHSSTSAGHMSIDPCV